jgi:hypothetical protein
MRTSAMSPVVRDSRLIAAALFVGMLFLYLPTLTRVHTFDALSYVTSVERKPWTELFHPHHLAYGPLGALALALGRALGYDGGAALPMQLVNAFAGALGVALFYVTAERQPVALIRYCRLRSCWAVRMPSGTMPSKSRCTPLQHCS